MSQRVYNGFVYVKTFDEGVAKVYNDFERSSFQLELFQVAKRGYAFMNSEAALKYKFEKELNFEQIYSKSIEGI